jgi:hypothetical protein
MGTYSCTSSSILCGATGDVDHLVFLDDLVITDLGGKVKKECVKWGKEYPTWGDAFQVLRSHRLG